MTERNRGLLAFSLVCFTTGLGGVSPSAVAQGEAPLSLAQQIQREKEKAFQLLDAPDDGQRSLGLSELLEFKVSAEEAVPLLLAHLKTPAISYSEQTFHQQILYVLGTYGLEARAAVPTLIAISANTQYPAWLRSAAVRALGDIGVRTPEVVSALIASLQDEKAAPFATEAPEALGKLGSAAHAAIPALEKALQRSYAPYQFAVFSALGEVAHVGADVSLTTEIARLQDWKSRPSYQVAAAFRAVQSAGRKASHIVPILVQLLKSDAPDYQREKALETLGSVGVGANQDAGELLVQLLQRKPSQSGNTDDSLQRLADLALRQVQPSDSGLITPLLNAITSPFADRPMYTYEEMCGALGRIGPKAAHVSGKLIHVLSRLSSPDLIPTTVDEKRPVRTIEYSGDYIHGDKRALLWRTDLYFLLADIGLPADLQARQEMVRLIARDLGSDPKRPGAFLTVVGAAHAAGALGRQGKEVVPALIQVLKMTYPTPMSILIRDHRILLSDYGGGTTSPQREAAVSLGKLGADAASALPALEEAAREVPEGSPWVRADTAGAAALAVKAIEAALRRHNLTKP